MKVVLFIILLNCFLFASQRETVYYGISTKSAILTKFKDAKVAVGAWLEDLGEIYNVNLKLRFYEGSEVLYEDYKNKKVDIAVFDVPFFFENRKRIEKLSKDKWSLSTDNERFTQYYLVANKKSSLKGFKSLKNRTLSLKKDDEQAMYWLDKNSYKANASKAKTALKSLNLEKNDRRALLKVFFGKADFAILPKKAWDILLEFNPSIQKRVEIIDKSQKIFVPFIGVVSSTLAKEHRDIFFNSGNDLKNIKGGDKIIEILKFDLLYELDEETVSRLQDYFNEYFILENKYR